MKPIRRHSRKLHRRSSGQALIESALMIPFVLMVICNAINFGYVFYVAQNMTAAVHSGALYSILGGATPYGGSPAGIGTSATDKNGVANLVYQDMLGALPSSDAYATVRLCSSAIGTTGTGAATKTTCSTISGTSMSAVTFPTIDADPEAPTFLLNRVDVAYQFAPLIPGAPFQAALLMTPDCSLSGGVVTCNFQSHVSMRVMN